MTRAARVCVLALVALPGCRRGDSANVGIPAPRGPEPAVAEAPMTTPSQEGGEAEGPLTRVPSSCEDPVTIDAGGRGSPEGVVWEAYRLALGPDGDAAVEGFVSLFSDATSPRHARTALWPRLREHVSKYVADPQKPSYVRCQRVQMDSGLVRLFVKSNDPRKSDPPIVLVHEGDAWKIDVLTP